MTAAPGARRIRIEHISAFSFETPARNSVMVLRLQPRDDATSKTLAFDLAIDPEASPVPFEDQFGNACHLVNIHRAHESNTVRSRADVETVDPAPLPASLGADAWKALGDPSVALRQWDFLAPSRFARPSPALAAFTRSRRIRRGADPLDSLLTLARKLYTVFCYEPGRTDVDSSIEQILRTGRGVCQDYVHVILAIARSWGIPSRYVSGYLHLEQLRGEQARAGATHAWAEFLLPDLGWIGIDPTNDTLADHRHIPIAVGRDYSDAAPTRGVVFGGGVSQLDVSVIVYDYGGSKASPPLHREHSTLTDAARLPPAGDRRADQQ